MSETRLRSFLAALRHDLRTPINAILGYSEMLIEDALEPGGVPAELAADIAIVHKAGEKLLTLISEALDQERIERGDWDNDIAGLEKRLKAGMTGPLQTVAGYCSLLAEDASAAGLRSWPADLQRIRDAAQSFESLVGALNAGAISTAAGRKIDTALASGGEGARPEGGDLLAGGARPAVLGELLVVDDNEINRDVLARRLERQGHRVAVAEDGRAAIEKLAASRFDLVLLDVVMPEWNGYAVLQWMKSQAGLRDIPVIMISALDEIDSVVRCIELGAEDYLPKPFNPVLLRARIGACLEKKRLRDKEVEYLNEVACVTRAAGEVEAGVFATASLDTVAGRGDELGQLARVFQRMAGQVAAREQGLRRQVQELRIQIDEKKKERAVAEITESDYFQQLQQKAQRLRQP